MDAIPSGDLGMTGSIFDAFKRSGWTRISSRDVQGPWTALHGLFRFQAQAEGALRHVDLRIDADTGLISGDLFRDAARTDWELSFQPTAIFFLEEDGTYLAHCDAFAARNARLDHRQARAHVAFRISEAEIHDLQIEVISDRNGVWRRYFNSSLRADTPLSRTSPFFRTLRLRYGFDSLIGESSKEAVRRLFASDDNRMTLSHQFRKARLDLSCEEIEMPALPQLSDRAGPLDFYQNSTDPWEYHVIFSGDRQIDAEDPRDVPFGRATGLDWHQRRHRARFGAAIFVGELIRYLTEPKAPTLTDERLDQRLLFTVMHEFGHLLNLPHPWQRDLAEPQLIDVDPSDETWMAYGSFLPFGSINAFAFQKRDTKEIRRQRHEAFLTRFYDAPAFAKAELQHLRHAPFDQIAVGKRTFTERLPAPVLIKAESTLRSHKLRLKLDQTDLLISNTLPDGLRYQPIRGQVKLSGTAASPAGRNPDQPLHFSFESGGLQLVIRSEKNPRDRRDHDRQTIVFNPVAFDHAPDLWNRAYAQTLTTLPQPDDTFEQLPFIPPSFWNRLALHRSYTVQALYLAPDGLEVRSNPVSISYRKGPVQTCPKEIATELLSPDFALLDSALARWDRNSAFVFPNQGLVEMVCSLSDEIVSQPSFKWLERLRAVARETQAPKTTSER